MAAKSNRARLDELRQQIRSLQSEREELDRRPVDRDTAISALDRWLASQRAEFANESNINDLLHGNPVLSLSTIRMEGRDWTSALATLIPDAIRAHFIERIDQALEGAQPMSRAERAERAAEIDEQLLDLETKEESVIRSMNQDGEAVIRRGDADPRVVLGLSEPPAAPETPTRTRPEPRHYSDSGRDVVHHYLPAEEGS